MCTAAHTYAHVPLNNTIVCVCICECLRACWCVTIISIVFGAGELTTLPRAAPRRERPDSTAAELAAVVDACYDEMDIVGMGENDPGVVFGGAGEPLLRLDTIAETIDIVRQSRHGVPFRVSTNGLFPASAAAALAAAGVNRATVSLATADPKQYDELMRPDSSVGGAEGGAGGHHAAVCGFICNLVEAGVEAGCLTLLPFPA